MAPSRAQKIHRRKARTLVATTLLTTTALLGTYLGSPRLTKLYASTISCGPAAENEPDLRYLILEFNYDDSCNLIEIASDISITYPSTINPATSRNLTIIGASSNTTITGGGPASGFEFLYVSNPATTLQISNLTISEFDSGIKGGAIYSTGDVTITHSTFESNVAGYQGGAIYLKGDLNISNSTFSGNSSAGDGGAIYAKGDIQITSSTFIYNSATGASYGGAIMGRDSSYTSTIEISNSTFEGNDAYYGGALFLMGDSTINNSTFVQNETSGAASSGGAILASNSNLIVTNSTFSDNESHYGGAILSDYNLDINNSIFQNNVALTYGDDIWLQTSNSIEISYSLFSSNLTIFDSVASAIVNWGTIGPGLISGDPLLGSLQNNGGPTQTMLPGSGSPAIDAGSNVLAVDASSNPLTTDQRGTGFARIAGASVDMGAVEVQGSSGGGWDGTGLNSLTSVLLQDQSGLDKTWSDHDILLNSLQTVLNEKPNSELKVLADGTVRLTAFIPTDRAFRRFAFDLAGIRPRNDKQTMKVIESLDLETIEKVLLYHVVLGDPISSEAALRSNGVLLTTISGESFRLRVTNKPNIFLRDNNKDLKNPKVLLKRVDINDGNRQVAHVINRVLIPIVDLK